MSKDRRAFLQLAVATVAAPLVASLALGARTARAAEKRRIGTIGSGRVGSALGSQWVRTGHEVMFSSLDLEHDKALAAKLGSNARAGTPREAAAFGEVLLVSVPYSALPGIGRDLADLLKGKIVIDTCNPFVNRDGEIATWAREKGAGLASAELLPGARIVRAFNAISSTRMAVAHEQAGRIGMPIASDDAAAVAIVAPLVRDIGYEPVLIGSLAMGKHLMPGTPLAGEHTPERIRNIAASLK